MLQVSISGDIQAALNEFDRFTEKDIPFAVSLAMRDTMFKARQRIVNETYPAAFTVRNARFPGVLWRVEGGQDIKAFKMGDADGMSVTLRQQSLPSRGGGSPDRDYMARHVTGGTKTAIDGGRVAVPQESVGRLKGGGVPKGQKPRSVMAKRGSRVVRSRTGSDLIIDNKDVVRFVLSRSARIPRRFRFYEDGMQTLEQEIQLALLLRMAGLKGPQIKYWNV